VRKIRDSLRRRHAQTQMAASLGLSATAARDWSRLRCPIVGRSRTGRDSTASCASQRSALHLRHCAIDASMALVNGGQISLPSDMRVALIDIGP
jgi:hypothetical protein